MSAEHTPLSTWEAGLRISPIAVWVVDAATIQLCWANDPALELWQAESREELFARDIDSNLPPKVAQRRDHLFALIRAGRDVREEWTFYPKGQAKTVVLRGHMTTMDDGRAGYLMQAQPVTPEASPDLLRTLAISRYASVLVALVDADGELLTRNTAASEAFGDGSSWRSWFVDHSVADELLADALVRRGVRAQAQVHTRKGLRWHVVDAQPLRDPVTGVLGVLVEHIDETARIEAEQLALRRAGRIDALTSTLELVEAQRQEILNLSAPLLDVGDRTLAVPLIGHLRETLSDGIVAKLLDSVGERHVADVILDLTGVVEVDEEGASRLHQLIRALQLLGASARIAGIRAEAAKRLIDAGIDFDGVETLRSLAEGLRARPRLRR